MFNNKKATTLFIVEGVKKEVQLFTNIGSFWFKNKDIKYIILPACGNIYILYQMLKRDDFETDLIEVIKEKISNATLKNLDNNQVEEINSLRSQDIDETYLFFDYDAQTNNLFGDKSPNTVISEMLDIFDNETDIGKLYISYPMIEALRDRIDDSCNTITGCIYNINNLLKYKHDSSVSFNNHEYSKEDWQQAITSFILRLSHLFEKNEVLSFDEYKNFITNVSIFNKELEFIENDFVFVLSAIPKFLLDYFPIKIWNTFIKRKKLICCSQKEKHCMTKH